MVSSCHHHVRVPRERLSLDQSSLTFLIKKELEVKAELSATGLKLGLWRYGHKKGKVVKVTEQSA